jgi:hypothetical protein
VEPLLLQATLFFSSLLSFVLLTQRTLPRGTRERPCPHRPCLEPENGYARSTRAGTRKPVGLRDQKASRPSMMDPARHPHGGRLTGPECRAEPGRLSVMDPSSVTDRRNEFIYKMNLYI